MPRMTLDEVFEDDARSDEPMLDAPYRIAGPYFTFLCCLCDIAGLPHPKVDILAIEEK